LTLKAAAAGRRQEARQPGSVRSLEEGPQFFNGVGHVRRRRRRDEYGAGSE
jgi:hypothetical protein